MPQLLFRCIEIDELKKISRPLVDELTSIIGCPRDYFTLDYCHTTRIVDGETAKGNPLVQVNWFARGQEIQDLAAQAIDKHLRQAGYDQIEVYFVELSEVNYYEQGNQY
ncbi:MAG: DUF1904 family protein [Sporomusaceae bacterium]|nr:DUF1904 family protein [Sporomusaceae bacterium]